MRFHERVIEHEQPPQDSAPGAAGGSGLPEMRQSVESYLRAGDDAINRALSGNSEAWLAAARQQGGQ